MSSSKPRSRIVSFSNSMKVLLGTLELPPADLSSTCVGAPALFSTVSTRPWTWRCSYRERQTRRKEAGKKERKIVCFRPSRKLCLFGCWYPRTRTFVSYLTDSARFRFVCVLVRQIRLTPSFAISAFYVNVQYICCVESTVPRDFSFWASFPKNRRARTKARRLGTNKQRMANSKGRTTNGAKPRKESTAVQSDTDRRAIVSHAPSTSNNP